MRKTISILILSLAAMIAACQGGKRAEPVPQDAVEYLVASAADDFRTHVAPTGLDFANVHPGAFTGENGSTRYILCGKYRAQESGDSWVDFATIQTVAYENWLGGAAIFYCSSPNTVLERAHDLTSALNERYNAKP